MRLSTFFVAASLVGILHAQPPQTDEQSIRALISAFASARNLHDGEAAARLYSEDGEWLSAKGYAAQGRTELARIWGGVTGQVQRTVESINLPGPNVTVVRVTTQYEPPIGRHHEIFICVKDDGTWKIRIHQSID